MIESGPYSKYAKRILTDALGVKRGENITIEAWEHEIEFAEEIKYQARALGANILLIVENETNYWRLFDNGLEKSLGVVGDHEWALLENSDVYIFFPGPADLARSLRTDVKRRSIAQVYNNEWYARATKAGIRGVRIRTSYLTPYRGKLYGFKWKRAYKNILDALDVDYQKMNSEAEKLAHILNDSKELSITGPGTKLDLTLSSSPPHIYTGLMRESPRYDEYSCISNIPNGELDLVPVPGSVEGKISFDLPVYQNGKMLRGLTWTFKDGRLVEYSAHSGSSVFISPFEKAQGDKDRVGALAIGLNPKISFGEMNDGYVSGALSLVIGSAGEGDKNKTDLSFAATCSRATLRVGRKKVIDHGKLLD